MTDKDIIKALECCASADETNCEKCPYDRGNCLISLPLDALALINRQQAKIEALKMDNKQLETDNFNANMNCEHLQAEVKRLEKANEIYAELEQGCYVTGYKKIRAEAVKEFITKAEESIMAMFNEHYYMGYETSEDDVIELLRNLAKEMVGENDA